MAVDQIAMFIATGLAFLLTLVWIGVHVYGLVAFLRLQDQSTSRRAALAWGLAFAGGFMGPCVFLASLVSMGLALAELGAVRRGDATPGTALATQLALITSTIIVVMVGLMVGIILVGMALAG